MAKLISATMRINKHPRLWIEAYTLLWLGIGIIIGLIIGR